MARRTAKPTLVAPEADASAAAADPTPPPEPEPVEVPIKGERVAPPESVTLKLVAVLAEVGSVAKRGKNTAQNYSFVREADLVERLRPLIARERLFLHQTIIKHEMTQQGQTRSGQTNWLTILTIRFQWVNADTGEVWDQPSEWIGYGQDTGDKGIGKAATSAEKYFLFKTFLVSTGDDPEGDDKVDRRAAEDGAAEGTRVSRRERTEGQGRGGRSAVPTPIQIRELWRLFGVAKMKQPEVVEFIGRILKIKVEGVDTAKRGELLNFVQSLPGAQVGILIRTLSEQTGDQGAEGKDADASDAAPGGDGDGAQPDEGPPADDAPPDTDLGDQPV